VSENPVNQDRRLQGSKNRGFYEFTQAFELYNKLKIR